MGWTGWAQGILKNLLNFYTCCDHLEKISICYLLGLYHNNTLKSDKAGFLFDYSKLKITVWNRFWLINKKPLSAHSNVFTRERVATGEKPDPKWKERWRHKGNEYKKSNGGAAGAEMARWRCDLAPSAEQGQRSEHQVARTFLAVGRWKRTRVDGEMFI